MASKSFIYTRLELKLLEPLLTLPFGSSFGAFSPTISLTREEIQIEARLDMLAQASIRLNHGTSLVDASTILDCVRADLGTC